MRVAWSPFARVTLTAMSCKLSDAIGARLAFLQFTVGLGFLGDFHRFSLAVSFP